MSFVVPDKNLNPTVDLPLSISEITKDVDAILVTHAHEDHFYLNDEAKISLFPFTNATTICYTQSCIAYYVCYILSRYNNKSI